MPYVHVLSNVSRRSVNAASVAKALSQRSAKILSNQDESKLMVQLSLDTATCFAGSDQV